jgi:hypothetical protein
MMSDSGVMTFSFASLLSCRQSTQDMGVESLQLLCMLLLRPFLMAKGCSSAITCVKDQHNNAPCPPGAPEPAGPCQGAWQHCRFQRHLATCQSASVLAMILPTLLCSSTEAHRQAESHYPPQRAYTGSVCLYRTSSGSSMVARSGKVLQKR